MKAVEKFTFEQEREMQEREVSSLTVPVHHLSGFLFFPSFSAARLAGTQTLALASLPPTPITTTAHRHHTYDGAEVSQHQQQHLHYTIHAIDGKQ